MAPVCWRVVREGVERDAVLAVDFGPGRAGAGFDSLADHLPPGAWVLETVPPPPQVRSGPGPDAHDHVRGLLADVGQQRLTVVGVLGYCTGAGTARLLAARVPGSAPAPLVLFDPEDVDAGTLRAELEQAVSSLSKGVTPDELAQIRTGIDRLDPLELGGHPGVALAHALHQEYHQVVHAVFTRMEMPAVLAGKLAARFDSYLTYLLLSAAAAGSGDGRPADLTVLSRGIEPPPGTVGDTVQFDVERGAMLALPEVAGLVARTLRRSPVTPAAPKGR
ncbi:hypothetical protein V6U90_24825 [Micromonospora sp. CPCC 206060]|uniref:hypothetical protein n=1 Tax=Micromonospora sp. CPCC 206060 TaxID=3122406 RepID=UPI002FEFD17C